MRLPILGELETAVLEYLWDARSADAKAVHRALGAARGISLNTIQSTVERLARKGLLTREKVSHAYVYTPALSREDWAARVINDVLADADGGGLLAAFVELAARLDTANLDRLERLIAERRRQERKP